MDVKVGDEVILNGNYIAKVIRITPTGRIRIDVWPESQFDKNGRLIGGDSWHCPHIEKATNEEITAIRKNQFVSKVKRKLKNYLDGHITYETALKLNEIMENRNEID